MPPQIILTVGILLLYVELNRPGLILPGALGLTLTLVTLSHANPLAFTLFLTATTVLTLNLYRHLPLPASAAATLTLILAFHHLFPPPAHWLTSILCGLLLGGATTYLTSVAHRARRNKALH